MSQLKVNSIVDASGGSNAQLYGVASPPNSMGFRNRILNGDCRIDQRNAGASVSITTATYTLDRFNCGIAQGSGHTCQRSTTAPAGFTNSLLITVGTGASPAAGNVSRIIQVIEGYNAADLGWGSASAQTVTLSFWVRSSLTGTFAGGLYNNAANRTYVFTYTINAANTWEQKSITITGDTSGTWLTDNGAGILVNWDLGTGSTYQGTAGSWAAGAAWATSGSVKLAATSGATFYITGVQLEAGTVASPFERRDYGRELIMCQRYYQVFYPASQEWIYNEATAAGGKWWQLYMPVTMRSAPTATYSSGMTGGGVVGLSGTISSLSLQSASVSRVSTRVTMSTASGTASNIYHTDSFDGDSVGLSSEL